MAQDIEGGLVRFVGVAGLYFVICLCVSGIFGGCELGGGHTQSGPFQASTPVPGLKKRHHTP